MPNLAHQPSSSVPVVYKKSYLETCERLSGESKLPSWIELGNLLAHRPDWRFELVNDLEPAWLYGPFGSNPLIINLTDAGLFSCYDVMGDRSFELASIDEVVDWLDPRQYVAQRHSIDQAKAWFAWASTGEIGSGFEIPLTVVVTRHHESYLATLLEWQSLAASEGSTVRESVEAHLAILALSGFHTGMNSAVTVKVILPASSL